MTATEQKADTGSLVPAVLGAGDGASPEIAPVRSWNVYGADNRRLRSLDSLSDAVALVGASGFGASIRQGGKRSVRLWVDGADGRAAVKPEYAERVTAMRARIGWAA